MQGGIVIGTVAGEKLRTGIALLVASVWAIVAISTLVTSNYTALGAVTPVMMIVVGFLFGYKNEKKLIQNGTNPANKDLTDW
jgi:glucose uptake protein GlcU